MVGKQVVTSSKITFIEGSIRYSGIDWTNRLIENAGVEPISANTPCVIAAVGGTNYVGKSFKLG